MIRRLIAVLMVLALASPGTAQTPIAAPHIIADRALSARANELAEIVSGTGDYQAYFAPSFHAALSKDKWDAVIAQLTSQLGKFQSIQSITAATPFSASLRLKFERGIVNAQIAVDSAPPHQVVGLLFTGIEVAGDTVDKLAADFRALPGSSGLGIFVLASGTPKLVIGVNAERAAPLGSAFKLWVLGELAREVIAGERNWAEVVAIGPPSLPSGIMQGWPRASPVTVHTLATLMISISDNTATDTLVTLEGTKLDAFVTATGAPGLAPIVTTRQMFVMKSAANADLAKRWTETISPASRRSFLTTNAARFAATPIEPSMFSDRPMSIETLEWFASPAQTATVLDWIRTKGSATALAILATNPGVDPATRGKFAYLGFKGGSEPGVLALNFLVKRTDGRWLAITGNWHRSDAAVDTAPFVQLMTRALALMADTPLPR